MATVDSKELVTAKASPGNKVPGETAVRAMTRTFTTAGNEIADIVVLDDAMPVGAEILSYCVVTSGTAAGASVTLSLGVGATANAIANALDIAANGVDSGVVSVPASGANVYATYAGANPADANVMKITLTYAVRS